MSTDSLPEKKQKEIKIILTYNGPDGAWADYSLVTWELDFDNFLTLEEECNWHLKCLFGSWKRWKRNPPKKRKEKLTLWQRVKTLRERFVKS